jgi:hypothetical protein
MSGRDFADVMREEGAEAVRVALELSEPAGQRPFADDYADPFDGYCPEEFEASLATLDLSPATPLPLECDGEIQPRLQGRYLIKGLIGTASKIGVVGPPGCGKSFLVYDWARHGCRGLNWFGRLVKPFSAVCVAAEGQGGVRNRHAAWDMVHGATGSDPFALIPTAVDLLNPKPDLPKLQATLDHFAARFGGLDLLVVDTLAASFGGGDENSSDMASYAANIDKLCAPYGCSCIIVHHSPLDATAKRPRGHSSLWGTLDAVFMVSGDSDAPARRIHCIKQKDGDPGPDIMFRLKQVEIGVDEDGDRVTSCVVEQSDLEPLAVAGKRKLSAKEKIVKAALDRSLVELGICPPAEIPENILNRLRTNKVVRTADWRAAALSSLASSDTKPDTARRTFDRSRENLQAAAIVGVWEDWAWLIF